MGIMAIMHELAERAEHIKIFRKNLKLSKGIRKTDVIKDGDLIFRPGTARDLRQIELLHLELFRFPLYGFLSWIYRFRARDLVSVVQDGSGNIIAYDLFFFQPCEMNDKILHELYVGVAQKYQDRGIGVKLRQYSSNCYDNGYINGISTLASFDNIKALRTAQKAGFAITKTSAKPLAHYLFKHLTRRFDK